MKAMVLTSCCDMAHTPEPLRPMELPQPVPGPGELLVRVEVCGVCHTELDEIEGRTPPPRFPVIPGHQVVGSVAASGPGAHLFAPGDAVGIAWIFHACGSCEFCRSGRENLCPAFVATGRDVNGGYAEYVTVPEAFAHPLPAGLEAAAVAPMLCAGAIGYRSLELCRPGRWPGSGPHRLRGLRPPGAADGAPPLSGLAGVRVRPQRRPAGLRPGAGGQLGRPHRSRIPREAPRRDRHHPGLDAGGGSPEESAPGRPAGDQRHRQAGGRQGRPARASTTPATSGARSRSARWPT